MAKPLSRATYVQMARLATQKGEHALANYYLRRAVDACLFAYEGVS